MRLVLDGCSSIEACERPILSSLLVLQTIYSVGCHNDALLIHLFAHRSSRTIANIIEIVCRVVAVTAWILIQFSLLVLWVRYRIGIFVFYARNIVISRLVELLIRIRVYSLQNRSYRSRAFSVSNCISVLAVIRFCGVQWFTSVFRFTRSFASHARSQFIILICT